MRLQRPAVHRTDATAVDLRLQVNLPRNQPCRNEPWQVPRLMRFSSNGPVVAERPYGQTFFGFLPIENVFGSAEMNS
jgi:hypothetical protein